MNAMRTKLPVLSAGFIALAVVLGVAKGEPADEARAHLYTHPNGNTTHLHIDADITNGSRPCDPIDDTATVLVGSVHEVGVCLEDYDTSGTPTADGGGTGSVEAFELHVRYTGDPALSDNINEATEESTGPPYLDDNPDANAGDDVTGFKLGGGWDCSNLGIQPPVGDDPSTPNTFDAVIVCNAHIIAPDKDLTADPGLLATIEFTAIAPGTDTIDFGPIDAANANAIARPRPGGGFAQCGTAVPGNQIGCFGATIIKEEPPTPTPTPKPAWDGNLTSVYDMLVYGTSKDDAKYHCIARIDHEDSGGMFDPVKMSAQCYPDIDFSDPTSALPTLPGQGPDGNPGPPPPPPYTTAAPIKLNGEYLGEPPPELLVLHGCFENIGGTLGPNAVLELDVFDVKMGLYSSGMMQGTWRLWGNQSIAQCAAKAPDDHGGSPPEILNVNLYPIDDRPDCPGGDCVQAPWREPYDFDFDDDGCDDWLELDKTGVHKCGDDPYNPYDGPLYMDDASGIYTMLLTVVRADWDKDADQLIPGRYPNTIFDLQQGPGKQLTWRAYTYGDSPLIPVNPEMGNDCSADPADCGDGLPGAAPPPPFGDVETEHAEFTGFIDNDENSIEVEGCALDLDGNSHVGHVYARIRFDLHTGQGREEVWTDVDETDCIGDGSAFVPGTGGTFPVQVARQSDKTGWEVICSAGEPWQWCRDEPDGPITIYHDTDGDGCPDKAELSGNETAGGLRDPFNRWDYFNPTLDGENRVDDILAVVNQYFIDKGNPSYTKKTDRTTIIGSNAWNLGPPNGEQRVDDILAAVKSYFHDCDYGTFVDPDGEKGHPTPTPTP